MRTRRQIRWWYLIGILAIVIGLGALGALRPLRSAIIQSVTPLQRFFYQRGIADTPASLTELSRQELITKVTELENQIVRMQQEYVTEALQQEEYQTLQQITQFTSRLDNYRSVSANVIGLGANQDPSVIIIDKGAQNSDVVLGAPLVSPEGAFIGTVAELYDRVSHVRLLTNPRAAVSVSAIDSTEPVGMVQGRFGLSAGLSLVPKTVSIAPGDLVYTSGLDSRIPPGILVAEVETIEEEPNTQFFHGLVNLRFLPQTLHVVSVLLE